MSSCYFSLFGSFMLSILFERWNIQLQKLRVVWVFICMKGMVKWQLWIVLQKVICSFMSISKYVFFGKINIIDEDQYL